MHQDDYYEADHVQLHRKVILQKHNGLGMICSESLSEDENGRRVPYPRASWVLDPDPSPMAVFLAHLRHHVYPFSGATFLTEVLQKYPIPWHSTAFPDTELVMKMCTKYKVVYADRVTVKYLENPTSESHVLSPFQRDFGAFQALIRVFTNESYLELCRKLTPAQLEDFLAALRDGIHLRIQDKNLAVVLTQTVMELTSLELGLRPEIASRLIEGYLFAGDNAAVRILEIFSRIKTENIGGPDLQLTGDTHHVAGPKSKRLVLSILSLTPYFIRKFMFKRLMGSSFGRRRLPHWNFNWDNDGRN